MGINTERDIEANMQIGPTDAQHGPDFHRGRRA